MFFYYLEKNCFTQREGPTQLLLQQKSRLPLAGLVYLAFSFTSRLGRLRLYVLLSTKSLDVLCKKGSDVFVVLCYILILSDRGGILLGNVTSTIHT